MIIPNPKEGILDLNILQMYEESKRHSEMSPLKKNYPIEYFYFPEFLESLYLSTYGFDELKFKKNSNYYYFSNEFPNPLHIMSSMKNPELLLSVLTFWYQRVDHVHLDRIIELFLQSKISLRERHEIL